MRLKSSSYENCTPVDVYADVTLSIGNHRINIVANGSSISMLPSTTYALMALIGSASHMPYGRRNLEMLNEWACMLGISLCLYDKRFKIIGINKNKFIFMSLQAMASLSSFLKRLLP